MYADLRESKARLAKVTNGEFKYDSSCAIDECLLMTADIAESEHIHIWNIVNGERFVTYAIKGQGGSGMISVKGSTAHRVAVGDQLIIASFTHLVESRLSAYQPKQGFVIVGSCTPERVSATLVHINDLQKRRNYCFTKKVVCSNFKQGIRLVRTRHSHLGFQFFQTSG